MEPNKEQNYSRPLSATTPVKVTSDAVPPVQHSKHHSVVEVSSPPQLKTKKSRWSLFSRKSMVVAAH
jgi:hypothetical protein